MDHLDGLNDAQRAAAMAVSGPVVIHAGAGTGKTRVISHRTAHAAATGAMEPGTALLLTFTDKAAGEMAHRIGRLGVPGVAAMTFHKAAWRQLRYFWPQIHGTQLDILSQPWRVAAPLVRRLPGHYRFTPTQDVLDAISWIKNSRVPLERLDDAAQIADRSLPIPADLMARTFRSYEQAKDDRSLIDFDDMILRTTDVLKARPEFLAQVHHRYRWFSVDEFQDTNGAQFDLLRLWLGEGRDLCVVGDENQTIYTFAGATSAYLERFETFLPGAASFDLRVNYRSSPQILATANALLAGAATLQATRPDGPQPRVIEFPDASAELRGVVEALREWQASGIEAADMAVLVRLNADIAALEAQLTRAGIPFQVRGTAFFERREIREVIRAMESLPGLDILNELRELLIERLGYDPEDDPATPEARERQAALETLLDIVGSVAPEGKAAVMADLRARADQERDNRGSGVTLSTLHRAKGLEWDAVVIPGLEQGHLPVQQATKSPQLLSEERRLLYVGITRARTHLVLTYSQQRPGKGDAMAKQRRSQFLDAIAPRTSARGSGSAGARQASRDPRAAARDVPADGEDALYERLKAWRLEVSKADEVPAYVVFSNSTLALIARARPTTSDQLAGISGVGPAKLERYSDDVLAIVADYLAESPPDP